MPPILPSLLFFLPLLTLSHSSTLLQDTCKQTHFSDFCMASLSSSPEAGKATDTKSIAIITVGLSANNATDTSAFAANLSKAATDPTLASLLAACSEDYTHARQALQSSAGDLKRGSYDYASVQVGAAEEYLSVCRRSFDGKLRRVVYPEVMAEREDVMQKLCTVSLDIIQLLLA